MSISRKDKKLNIILNEVARDTKALYGNKLKEILLYGSYARGEYDNESDIDLMVLIDVEESELRQYDKKLNNIINEIGYRHLKVLSILDLTCERLKKWVDVVPFYKKVRDEGIVIYEK